MLLRGIFYCLSNILFIVTLHASTMTVTGNVSGLWNTDTVRVSGDITVPLGSTLTIQPGCRILFDGAYKLTVSGKLIAVGNAQKIIHFEPSDTTGFSNLLVSAGGWKGLIIVSPSSSPSQLEYCAFQFMKNFKSIDLTEGYSSFWYCTFSDNRGNVVYIGSKGHSIKNCIFTNNYSTPVTIQGIPKDTIFFENNTLAFNTGGVNFDTKPFSTCILTNNIFWGPEGYINQFIYSGGRYPSYDYDTSSLIVRNCIISLPPPPTGNILGPKYFSCYQQDPKFVNAAQRDFSLRWDNYPAADTGRSIAIDNGYHLSSVDDDSSRRDIGAIPFFRSERRNHTSVRFTMDSVLGDRSSLRIQFTNLSNIVLTPVSWLWNFGDGGSSTAKNPIHDYTTSGKFSPQLIAIDQDGHRDTLTLANTINVLPGTIIYSSAVSGIWEKQFSPYYIYGYIYVPVDKRLEIRQGVEVRFMGNFDLNVFGSLIAKGIQNDSIRFIANDTSNIRLYKKIFSDYPDGYPQTGRGWGGIHFVSELSRQDSCMLEYCSISDIRSSNRYPRYQSTLLLDKIKTAIIKNSRIHDNYTGYFTNVPPINIDTSAYGINFPGIATRLCSPVIENNRFDNLYNLGGPSAILSRSANSITITGNTFLNMMSEGVYLINSGTYHFSNNTMDSITTTALYLQEDDSLARKRTILNEIKGNIFSNSRIAIDASGKNDIAHHIGNIYKTRISNNIFKNNGDTHISNWNTVSIRGDSIYVSNNLFFHNKASDYLKGGVCIYFELINSKTGVIANNTFVNNAALGGTNQSIIYCDDSVKLYNNILTDSIGLEVQGFNAAPLSKLWHNNIKGGYSSGVNNYDEPPLFVDSLKNDYRLKKTSTSINRGFPDTTNLQLPALDFFGNPRIDIFSQKIDVGFFEYTSQKPAAFKLSKDTVMENLPLMSFIGKIKSTGTDSLDTFTYSLINIPGIPNNNNDFIIRNDSLFSGVQFKLSSISRVAAIRKKDIVGAYLDSSFIIKILINPTTGFADLTELRKIISIYPIPFTNQLILEPKNYDNGTWNIYSISGKLIKSGMYHNKTILNLPDLSSGIYILRLLNKGKTYSMELMKQ